MATEYVKQIPNTAILIDNTISEYVDIDGSIYKITKNNKIIKKKLYQNKINGYLYVGIDYNNGRRSTRVHRLVAKAFIDNPYNMVVVGHKNNIKNDNRVSNLYWTTTEENTQKAFDDGLAKNDIGIDDSQSTPVAYMMNDGTLLSVYGSRTLASKLTKCSKTTICRQSNNNVTYGKFGYYFKIISYDEYDKMDLKFKNIKFQYTTYCVL